MPNLSDSRDRPWLIADDSSILKYIERGYSIDDTARLVSRSPEEVRKRLAILADEARALFPKDIAAS